MRESRSLTEILGDFSVSGDAGSEPITAGAPITLWLPKDYKARYERLQQMSRKRFSRKLRDAAMALIELAEARAS